MSRRFRASCFAAFLVLGAPGRSRAADELAAPSPTKAAHEDVVGGAFARRHLSGAFAMMKRASGGRWHEVVTSPAASERQIPASTFKIVNSLIALQTGTVGGAEVLEWDGKPRGVEAWEHDMTLAQALKASCVPCYQQLARRVGLERMQAWLRKLGYGNADAGKVVDRFWLDGPLAISPAEQVELLRRLYEETLPFDRRHQQYVKRSLFVEEANGYRLFAKTGWARAVEPNVGWYVGWVEARDGVYVFATLVRVASDQPELMLEVRKDLTLDILKALGVLPEV